jgi:hypothetical protein
MNSSIFHGTMVDMTYSEIENLINHHVNTIGKNQIE